jgi:hypothetical protein
MCSKRRRSASGLSDDGDRETWVWESESLHRSRNGSGGDRVTPKSSVVGGSSPPDADNSSASRLSPDGDHFPGSLARLLGSRSVNATSKEVLTESLRVRAGLALQSFDSVGRQYDAGVTLMGSDLGVLKVVRDCDDGGRTLRQPWSAARDRACRNGLPTCRLWPSDQRRESRAILMLKESVMTGRKGGWS